MAHRPNRSTQISFELSSDRPVQSAFAAPHCIQITIPAKSQWPFPLHWHTKTQQLVPKSTAWKAVSKSTQQHRFRRVIVPSRFPEALGPQSGLETTCPSEATEMKGLWLSSRSTLPKRFCSGTPAVPRSTRSSIPPSLQHHTGPAWFNLCWYTRP